MVLNIYIFRRDLAFEYLAKLCQRFGNGPESGKIVVNQLELLIQFKQAQQAKELVEQIITGTCMLLISIT